MSKVQLKLKSVCAITIKDANGKSYRLKSGQNVLDLEYEDYLALTKSLGIRPKSNNDNKLKPVHKVPDKVEDKKEDKVAASQDDSAPKSNDTSTVDESTPSDDNHDEAKADDTNDEQSTPEKDASIDYSTLTYNQLKAEYKSITGINCKLKKNEIIAFLQEHDDV